VPVALREIHFGIAIVIHDETLPECVAERLSDDRLAIFLVHGVIPRQVHPVRNYTGKHLEADLFAKVIKRLARDGHALSMAEVLAYCESGGPFPPRAFAMTFDDGFENNLSVAAPIMADHDVPGMIYITSGFIDENGMSWIDRIELAVEEASAQELVVDWAPHPFRLHDPASRIDFLKAVRRHVKNSPEVSPNAFADALCARLGKSGRLSSNDPLDLKLNWDQVRDAEGGLITFGGHSHTHPILSFLSPSQLACELDVSLGLMREKSGIGPAHYSYPEGLPHCFSDDVIAQLKTRGVRCCPTAIDGVNSPGTDPFLLRRVMVA
jgi:peptidoglycan/xylan/chitin deacetylase (PgdA/CDA1 family)